MMHIKLMVDDTGKDYLLKIEPSRPPESAESMAVRDKSDADYLIQIKEQAAADAKRKKLTEQIIERHKHIPNYQWRMTRINNDLNAFGYPPLSS